MTVERRATACRICAIGCGTFVDIEDGRIVKVTGDPDDPWSYGFTCSKGRAGPELHHRADRIDTPLARREGVLTPLSWDEALDEIAQLTRSIIGAHGAGVIANYVGTGGPIDPAGYAMAHGFFRALGTHQHYSALSIDCSGKALIPQLVSGVQLMYQPDVERAALLMAVGVNTVVSHGHGVMLSNPLVTLRDLRARGGKFVVVDPRFTESARHADLHVALRPGTDPAFLAYLVRSVLASAADHAYLDACASAESVARLALAVAPFDASTTAAICGVSEHTLAEASRLIAEAGRVAIETGTGTTMNRSANLTEWLVWSLAAVTGSLDRPGGALFNPGFLRPMEDALPAGRGDLGPAPASRPELRRLVNGEMPCSVLADEIEAGNVRALFVRLGNPALAIPGNARLRDALRQLDLLVAIDVVPTETTSVATHVLPMADHFERSDLVTGYLQATPFLRFAPAVVPPIGARRSQWWMFAELSRRLELPLFGSARRDAALADVELDDEVIAASIAGPARRPWDEVRAAPYGVMDDSLAPGWLIPDRLPQRLDLAPAELVDQLSRTTFGSRVGGAGELLMINRRTSARYNSLSIRPSTATLYVHPVDASTRGLEGGSVAVVSTPSGSCQAVVEVNDTVPVGVVSLPHGFGDTDVNQLLNTRDVDPLNGMPVMSGYPVKVEKAATSEAEPEPAVPESAPADALTS
jgi:anaerobic selenocysteine-containing dehydrogenase